MTETPEPLSDLDVALETPLRLAFPSFDKMSPKAKGSDKLAYQGLFLIPPDVDLAPFKKALRAALVERFGEVPKKLDPAKNPLKAVDELDEDDRYDFMEDGWHFIRATSGYMPACVDEQCRPVPLDRIAAKFYSGCWVRVHLKAFAWDNKLGGKGVSMGLEAVQFHHDDTKFVRRSDPKNVFAPIGRGSKAAKADDADDLFA